MKFYLIVAKGTRRGFPIPIEADLFVMGGHRTCQLRKDHPEIGGQHCAIAVRFRKVFIRDLGSGSATFVNGEPMPASEEWPLHPGDRIALGPLEFMINFREKALSQRDLEEWALKQLDEDTGKKVSAIEELLGIENAGYDEHSASSVAGNVIAKLSAQKGVVRGRLRVMREDGMTVVKILDANLVDDAELALLRKELLDNLNMPGMRVLLDFKHVRRMTHSAADTIAGVSDALKRKFGSLAVCRLRPELRQMMADMQSVYHFRIFPDKDAAAEAGW